MPYPKHFDGRRFYNPGGPQARGLLDVLRWKLTSRAEASPKFVPDVQETVPPRAVEAGEIRTTLVNHATVLVQQSGCNVLTDPIWSERASPVSWAGPRRRRKPGVRLEDLPDINVVLISHNHYDHLDLPTLRWLALNRKPEFVAPKGVGRLLRAEKIEPVSEVDWGEGWVHGGTNIHCVPALHFSARGMFDRNKTLWCGYVISSVNGVVYFAGDTAFGEHFGWIRERFGAPRLGLLPIGAYEPRWFMAPVHMSPDEALEAHRILECEKSIGIHQGTFQLADEALDAPRERVLISGAPESFLPLKNGEWVTVTR